ncbi:uncharacterized protein LAESUDRAFT_658015 [Laetiporus sulphureus 93-53]|uniref:Uncharacterized protein n=1 Tax=Laetiporus sulphureus 93-53 TaxID=1314785 RepID=A0A165D7N2_9APHY|nr:uncharacterized protein LAESUDRAFT_658015 [Laetiporus sulphureus 93-53]KZT04286.1 hypothetical protein LAESUDRAFT_658015 [Laetiporus sulphureus 93-53]
MSTKVFEHAFYIGGQMSAILYGVDLVMYFTTMQALLTKSDARRSDRFFTVYSTIMLLLLTIDVSTNAVWGEQMWITFRDEPGGVPEFIATQTAVWYETLSSTSVVALIFMSDALLIYRCFILWGSRLVIIVLPILVYLAAFALAICELVSAGVPGGDFFAGKSVNFGVPYYALSIALNICLTLLICGRLVYLSRFVRAAMGRESAQLYTGLASLMIESAAPYSMLGIMFLVPYARGSDVSIAFGQVWAKLTCLSPQLIVLRVATRRAWDRTTISQAQSMQFATGATSTVQPSTGTSKSDKEDELLPITFSTVGGNGAALLSPVSDQGSGKWSRSGVGEV